tara:strand:- start:1152 stop:1994 length:843 start_codon:yes stop_codon:yes gene_type:complete
MLQHMANTVLPYLFHMEEPCLFHMEQDTFPSTPPVDELFLGGGTFGSVVKRDGKVIKTSLTEASLEHEYKVMLHLRGHPNVLHAIALSSNGLSLEVEFGGVDLFHVRHNSTGPLDVRHVYPQILSGVTHLHHKRIAHLDLKLENLVLGQRGVVKIIDFGLSSFYPGYKPALTNIKAGSPTYVAPEVMVKYPAYDPFAADAWSLGVVLYAYASDSFPFPEARDSDTAFCKFKNLMWCNSPSMALKHLWARSAKITAVTDPYVWQQIDTLLHVDPTRRARFA